MAMECSGLRYSFALLVRFFIHDHMSYCHWANLYCQYDATLGKKNARIARQNNESRTCLM